MAKIVSITFEDERQCYYPGSTVRGTVAVSVVKPKNYKCLVVKMFGRAQVGWTEGCGSDRFQSNHVHRAKF